MMGIPQTQNGNCGDLSEKLCGRETEAVIEDKKNEKVVGYAHHFRSFRSRISEGAIKEFVLDNVRTLGTDVLSLNSMKFFFFFFSVGVLAHAGAIVNIARDDDLKSKLTFKIVVSETHILTHEPLLTFIQYSSLSPPPHHTHPSINDNPNLFSSSAPKPIVKTAL